MKVKFKKLHKDAVVPQYSRDGDAGLDLVAVTEPSMEEILAAGYTHEFIEYDTGLAVEIPQGYFGAIFPRSSISKTSLSLCNAVGVVDSNYRGSIKFRFRVSRINGTYKKGDRIGQLIILPYPKVEPTEVEELSDTNRGNKGFGSSGA